MGYKDKQYIHISINKTLRETLKKEAEEKGMTLNAYVNLILSERKKR